MRIGSTINIIISFVISRVNLISGFILILINRLCSRLLVNAISDVIALVIWNLLAIC